MDLTTSYLGLTLKNPLIAGACSLTGSPDGAKRLEAAGFGALVVRSLFEEHVLAEGEAATTRYLANLTAIRQAVSIPVLASVNCRTSACCVTLAREVASAGVSALELNIYDIPDDPGPTSEDIEKRQVDLVRAVVAATRLPLAVKLGPFYTALIPFCRQLEAAGVKGLVLFNRFMQPDINTETGHLRFNVNFSRSEDLRLPLRWTAILRDQLKADIALSGGVHTANDAIQAVLVGANAVCLCSALYQRRDANPAAEILDGLKGWLAKKGHTQIGDFRGAMRTTTLGARAGFERAHYVKTVGGAQ